MPTRMKKKAIYGTVILLVITMLGLCCESVVKSAEKTIIENAKPSKVVIIISNEDGTITIKQFDNAVVITSVLPTPPTPPNPDPPTPPTPNKFEKFEKDLKEVVASVEDPKKGSTAKNLLTIFKGLKTRTAGLSDKDKVKDIQDLTVSFAISSNGNESARGWTDFVKIINLIWEVVEMPEDWKIIWDIVISILEGFSEDANS